MKPAHAYLVLCVLGTVLPYSQLIPWMAEYGYDITLLFQQVFEIRAGAVFAMDLTVTALTFVAFVLLEGKRRPVPGAWMAVAAIFLVGVSLGFPLYLWLRERERVQSGETGVTG